MCDAICIGTTQQIIGKIVDGYLYNVQWLIKTRQNQIFIAHCEQNFKYTMAHTDIYMCVIYSNYLNISILLKI